jgi:hypothetical protein
VADAAELPEKNETDELPVPFVWRPTIKAIVDAFVAGDWALTTAPVNVSRLSPERAAMLRDNVAGYGPVTLIPLSEQTWDSSVAIWMLGKWEVIVDLWTREEGRSDLIVHLFVAEAGDDYDYKVHLVYVP